MKNPTYYKTIVQSDIWKEWTKYQEKKMKWDIHESIECGWLSENHWKAFIRWLTDKKAKKAYKDGFNHFKNEMNKDKKKFL